MFTLPKRNPSTPEVETTVSNPVFNQNISKSLIGSRRHSTYDERTFSMETLEEFVALRKLELVGSDAQPLLKSAEGYAIEECMPSAFGIDPKTFQVEGEEYDSPYY